MKRFDPRFGVLGDKTPLAFWRFGVLTPYNKGKTPKRFHSCVGELHPFGGDVVPPTHTKMTLPGPQHCLWAGVGRKADAMQALGSGPVSEETFAGCRHHPRQTGRVLQALSADRERIRHQT